MGKGDNYFQATATDMNAMGAAKMTFDIRSRKSGNIGYNVDSQQLKWQHFKQHGGNNRQHYR
jgi:hypothetical protein